MSKAWAAGSTRQWRIIRAAVLARDGYLCQLHLPGCTIHADCAHHVYGRSVTGDDADYIVAACTHCNLAVGEPTSTADPPLIVTDYWWER